MIKVEAKNITEVETEVQLLVRKQIYHVYFKIINSRAKSYAIGGEAKVKLLVQK